MSKALNLCGLRFGRLVAIKRVENSKSGKAKWLCRCDCGNEKIIFATNLVRGLTHSCGWFMSWQFRLAKMYIDKGWLYYAEKGG